MSKIIHIEFKEPVDEKNHYYFGSLAAIYDRFSVDQIGISQRSLSNNYNLSDCQYENKKVIIRLGELCRKNGNRGRRERGDQ